MFSTEIEAGAAALDEAAKLGKVPADWRENLDLNTLDISSVYSCVTAQTFRGRFDEVDYRADHSPWSFGVDFLAAVVEPQEHADRHKWSSAHGFSVDDVDTRALQNSFPDSVYPIGDAENLLTEEWKTYLTTGELS